MSKYCNYYKSIVLYMDCLECEEKYCKNMNKKYNTICIGIDQSYKCTGVSISIDGELKKIAGIDLSKFENNSEKRKMLSSYLSNMLGKIFYKSNNIICVIERIRLRSDGFININYIKSIGALNSVIVDIMHTFNIPVYSVDTRAWKAQIIGTTKTQENKFGVDPKKYPTVKWIIEKGFKKSVLEKVEGRKEKGTFTKNGIKYRYNDDKADSAAISLFYFYGKKENLKEEK